MARQASAIPGTAISDKAKQSRANSDRKIPVKASKGILGKAVQVRVRQVKARSFQVGQFHAREC